MMSLHTPSHLFDRCRAKSVSGFPTIYVPRWDDAIKCEGSNDCCFFGTDNGYCFKSKDACPFFSRSLDESRPF